MEGTFHLKDIHFSRFFPSADISCEIPTVESPHTMAMPLLKLLENTPPKDYPFIEKLLWDGNKLTVTFGDKPREYWLPRADDISEYFRSIEYALNKLPVPERENLLETKIFDSIYRIHETNPWYPWDDSSLSGFETCKKEAEAIEHQPVGFLDVLDWSR